MADFEGLIRQALARQDTSDPAAREKIYQASRNALARMIASGGALQPSEIQHQRDTLEACIRRIEAGYRQEKAAPPAQSEPPGPPPEKPARRERRTGSQPAPPAHDEEFLLEDAGGYEGASGGLSRVLAIAAVIGLLVVIGGLLYWLVLTIGGAGNAPAGDPAQVEASSVPPDFDSSDALTILSAANTDGLVTAGRGSAEIISQPNQDLLRLTSVRQEGQPETPAQPIMIRLGGGVVEQIAGRRVTIEVMARSGGTGPATFAIGCDLGADACGRKRFRVGLQPEAIVFTVNAPASLSLADEPHFEISTDITGSAALSGRGDAVDIVYARLRVGR